MRRATVKRRKLRLLIVGAGDVARRLVAGVNARPGSRDAIRWLGLARSEASAHALRQDGILPVAGDLDLWPSLRRAGALGRSAAAVLLLAPPPNEGADDPRLRRWLAAVSAPAPRSTRDRARLLVRRHRRADDDAAVNTAIAAGRVRRRRHALRGVYVSTTGVYGDCAGERIDETRRARPASARARRRVAAEARVRSARSQRLAILRAPGIYAADRLPVERLRAGTPALAAEDDVYSNHIHADDLARAAWLAVFRGRSRRAINVVDDSELHMGEYFDQVAAAVGLPRPRRLPRAQLIGEVSPMLYSFMSESRRIDNTRMQRELRLRLAWPTPAHFLRHLKPAAALQRTLL